MSEERTAKAQFWTAAAWPGRLFLAILALAATPAAAQQIPTGYQEYFVLGHEQQVWLLLNRVVTGEGGGYTAANGMNSVVSAVASADGQRIYYDHWEDGLEANLLTPVQATTWVFGDGNAANGDACPGRRPRLRGRHDHDGDGADARLGRGPARPRRPAAPVFAATRSAARSR